MNCNIIRFFCLLIFETDKLENKSVFDAHCCIVVKMIKQLVFFPGRAIFQRKFTFYKMEILSRKQQADRVQGAKTSEA